MKFTVPTTGCPAQSSTCLHVISKITETSAPYNEHCLGSVPGRRIAIATYYKSALVPPRRIPFYEGDGTLVGFSRVLIKAFTEQNCRIVHAHSPIVGLLALVAGKIAARRGASYIVTVHNSFPNFRTRSKLLLLPLFGLYDKVICCGQKSLESFPTVYRRLARRRLSAVPNGVDVARIDQVLGSRVNRRSSTRFTVASVGRLIEIKSPTTVLQAFRCSADDACRLTFVGGGDLGERLLADCAAAGLGDRVILTGVIPRDEVYRHLSSADLFVSASRGEGLPVAALEAMACCCPVVLSDIEPHREIAAGASFLPLVPPDDVTGFAREIRRFADMTPGMRSQVGRQCRRLVEQRFSLEAMHQRYGSLYAEIIAA